MDILVVTGGIGSGKSEVCSIIRDVFPCEVYEADRRVKQLYDVHPALLSDIEFHLGCCLRDGDGKFRPACLAERIFSDRTALEKVESLVFPALMDDFAQWASCHGNCMFVVFESATILEKPQFEGFADKVIVVDAPFQLRLKRACSRDGLPEDSVRSRMINQVLMNRVSEGKIPDGIDAVIMNDGDMDDLRRQTVKTVNELFGTNF